MTDQPGIGFIDDFDAHHEFLLQALPRSPSSARQGRQRAGEWILASTAHNVRKLHRDRAAG